MNVRHLRTLVAIADSDSFLAAAERLYLTPAAVSQQMKSLEDELQVPLFDRSTRPPRLNPHGASLVERARGVLQSYDAFVDAAGAPGELAGRLVLGCVNGVSSDLLPRALANLRQRHPRVRVRIEEGQSASLTHGVLRRELDAAIVTEGQLPEPELRSLPVLNEPLIVVAPDGSPGATWKELLETHAFLRINRRSGMGTQIDRVLRREGIVLEEAMELDSSEAIVSMALAGLGAGVVPAGRLSNKLRRRLRTLAFGDPPVSRRVILVERRNNQRSELAQVLYEELQRLVISNKPAGQAPVTKHLGWAKSGA